MTRMPLKRAQQENKDSIFGGGEIMEQKEGKRCPNENGHINAMNNELVIT